MNRREQIDSIRNWLKSCREEVRIGKKLSPDTFDQILKEVEELDCLEIKATLIGYIETKMEYQRNRGMDEYETEMIILSNIRHTIKKMQTDEVIIAFLRNLKDSDLKQETYLRKVYGRLPDGETLTYDKKKSEIAQSMLNLIINSNG
mgnify:FL=1